jgi:hypothetical protein
MIHFKILFICWFGLYFNHSFAQGYTLTGKIKGVEDGWVFIKHRQYQQTDSGRIIKGRFLVTGPIDNPEFCNFGLSINGLKDYYLGFFLERGSFNMVVNKDSLNDISIIFSPGQVEKEFQEFQRQVSNINRKHYPDSQADAKLEQLAEKTAAQYPKSYVSAFALFSYEKSLSRLSGYYAKLSIEIRRSYYGNLIQNKLKNH